MRPRARGVEVGDRRGLGHWRVDTARGSIHDVPLPPGSDPFGARVVLVTMCAPDSILRGTRAVDARDPTEIEGLRA